MKSFRMLNGGKYRGQKIETLFIVDAPDDQDIKRDRLFSGPSYTRLTSILDVLEHDLSTMAVVCLVDFCPPERKPYKREIRACRDRLDSDIGKLKPERIITLGALPWKELGDGSTLTRSRLRVVPSPWEDITMSATIHPSATLFDPTKIDMLAEDIDALLSPKGEETISWRQVKSVPKSLLSAPEIVFDIETLGLKIGKEITLVGYKLPKWKVVRVSPFRGNESIWKQILLDPDKTLLGHNIKFDLSRLAHALQLPTIRCKARDSMISHFLCGEDNTARSLERLSKIHTNLRDFKTETEKIWSAGGVVPLKELAERNAYDVEATAQVYTALEETRIKVGDFSPGLDWMYRELIPFIGWLEQIGIGVDQAERKKQTINHKRLATRDLNQLLGLSPGLNPGSPKQLAKILFDDWGITPSEFTTPSGAPSTGKPALNALLETDLPERARGLIKSLLSFRGHKKVLSSYLDNLADTDIVYPEYFLVRQESQGETDVGGTVTGRLAVKRPAMQTISNGPLRKIFASRWDKGMIWCIDAAQMELKVLAALSGCRALLDVFSARGDLHQWTADLCRVPRRTGKLINFASVYGCSPEALMAQAGLDYNTAYRVTGTLQEAWAELYDFLLQVEVGAMRNKRSVTPYGAIRRLPLAAQSNAKGAHSLRQAVNFQGQRPGSDLVQLLGSKLLQECNRRNYTPILSVHDEILIDSKLADRSTLQKIKRAVKGWRPYVEQGLKWCPEVEMEWEVSCGPNWGEQTVVEVLHS